MTIESPFYTLTLDPQTGAVASLHDKIRNVELVDPTSAYCLNEGLYTTGDALETESYTLYSLVNFDGAAENRSRLVEVKPSVSGPVFNEMKVITCVGVIQVITTYRLYHAVDRLDICNEVVKPVAPHKEQLDFAFPFHVPNRNVRIETPGVILDPETDRLPGAGLSVHAVRRFVDVFNEEYGVTLVMDDSGLVQFGHRTTAEDPLGLDPNATLLCVALGNVYDWNEAIRDQGGVTQFTFRYSIAGHAGGFDPVAAVRFGWGDEMEVIPLPAGKRRGLPFPNHSFIGISPTQTVLTGMCAAEAGGIALRLWEISGEDSGVVVDAQGLGECIEAYCIDLLETEQYSIPTQSGKILLPLPGHGLGAVRLTFKDQDNLSEG